MYIETKPYQNVTFLIVDKFHFILFMFHSWPIFFIWSIVSGLI